MGKKRAEWGAWDGGNVLLFGLEEESPRHSTAPLKWASSWTSTQSSLCLPVLPSPPKPLGSVYTVSQGRRNLGCWQRWAVLEENRAMSQL